MPTIPFTKMHGIGNDFVMVDAMKLPISEAEIPELAKAMCDRRFGIGGDGLILIEKGATAPYRMHMLNPDGSEGGMCGNGLRCVAKFLQEHGYPFAGVVPVDVTDRTVSVEILGSGCIRVDMGKPLFLRGEVGVTGDPGSKFIDERFNVDGAQFRGTAIGMGNPHVVILTDDVAAVDLARIGPRIEHSDLFPNRVNVHFVQVLSRNRIRQRTWERGAGVTLACGSGACACAVASIILGLADNAMTIELPGGELRLSYEPGGNVVMEGPATSAFAGEFIFDF